jgi:VWFA-related protein
MTEPFLKATCTLVMSVVAAGAMSRHPAPQDAKPGELVFASRAELVVLHVTVKDRTGAYMAGLPADAFIVVEDERPQTIRFFAPQDAPVTVGLLVDSSGSMLAAKERLAAAAAAFVDTSHPQDEIFALAFNEHVRPALPPAAPFAGNAEAMRAALGAVISARGRTALHDAILAGLDYADKGTHLRKVLVVMSDGADNASGATFDDVLTRTLASNTAIYTLAFIDPLERDANPARLRKLAQMTGGEAFQPRRIADVGEVLMDVARDIRSTYTIGYVPADMERGPRLRRIRVRAIGADGRMLTVRTRQGYTLER